MDVVNRLLDYKELDVNFQGEYGDIALIKASQYGHSEIVRLLLKNKANVNLKDNNGRTALMEASSNGRLKVVELLKKIHRNQIREGFKMANKDGSFYVYDEIVNLISDFTY